MIINFILIKVYIIYQMAQRKQKQQPFYIKRIRLKKSIIKTQQILQGLLICDHQFQNHKSKNRIITKQHAQLNYKKNKFLCDRSSINQSQLYFKRSPRFNPNTAKNIIKMFKPKMNQTMNKQVGLNGLEIRRIIGDPKNKKSQNITQNRKNRLKTDLHKTKQFRLNYSQQLLKKIESQSRQNNKTFNTIQNVTFNSIQSNDESSQFKDKDVSLTNTSKRQISSARMKTPRTYLYERMMGSEIKCINQINYVYQKRIKSYVQFLWKCMIAHNVYYNLDLEHPTSNYQKQKAFVGYGNNCNMIKGLIKRRFWWTISEQYSSDCLFIWTQIKINNIYNRQQIAKPNQSSYIKKQPKKQQPQELLKQNLSLKRKNKIDNIVKMRQTQKWLQLYSINRKLLNQDDYKHLMPYFLNNHQKTTKILYLNDTISNFQKSYLSKIIDINTNYKHIQIIDKFNNNNKCEQENNNYYKIQPIVHNHLQNNFYLGNKKALFYNLKEYYLNIKEDPFQYIPLTFHIKKGMSDPQYKKFVQFYQKRQKEIKKQVVEQYNCRIQKKRNIWIVKPGQNSNQGRGITVIDEIYELNNLIKTVGVGNNKSKNTKSNGGNDTEQIRTYIVQMYIDRPFLYNNRKFDIRHYMLITNLFGVTRAYWYDQGYIRTSSYLFNINNFEPEIHLTNDAIQKQYPQYGKYESFNKISYADFQHYLFNFTQKKYSFKDQILPQMKKIATDTARSVYGKISPKNQMNNFQIFGLDFMIDRNFKPWLIEVNTNPCLDCMCPLLERIIPYMVEQSLKLSLDVIYPPPCHYPNNYKHFAPYINLQTFKYQLIFDSLQEVNKIKHDQSSQADILSKIGEIQADQQFKDNGKQMKLQDFT